MQCGPAPLAAIKKGHIYIGYDTGFVFAEVNADRVEWIVKQEGSYNYIKGTLYSRGSTATSGHFKFLFNAF